MAFAKKFFSNRIEKLGITGLESIYERVTQRLLFNIYTISEEIDVSVAFETMNNRGKPLSHLELLKNRLIYLSTKFQVDQSEKLKLRSVINESWKAAYHYLGKNQTRPLNDDDFLKTHFFMYFGPQLKPQDGNDFRRVYWKFERGDYYKDFLLADVFTSRRLSNDKNSSTEPMSVDLLYDYAKSLKNSVHAYYYLFTPSESPFSNKEKIYLERLRRLEFDTDTLVLLLTLNLKEKNSSIREQVLNLLERLEFISSISPHIPNLERMDILAMGVDLSAGEIASSDVVEKLETHFTDTVERIRLPAIFAEWSKRLGYFRWSGIRYFMFEYEQSLLASSRSNREKLNWEEFIKEDFEKDYKTVEHIYPQKAADECWKRSFNRYSIPQRNVLKHSIGNLVPLSRPKNSSLQNKCFSEKKGNENNKVGFAYGCYSEIEVSQCADWTPTEILKRGMKLLDFMEVRWGINIGSPQEKIKALGLNFIDRTVQD